MKHRVCKILLLAIVLLFLKSYYVKAQQNPVISFQGVLTDASGKPVNGIFNFTFKIYNDSTEATPLWIEHHSLSVQNGLYNVLLGNKTSLTDALTFDTDYWLGIEINATGEMTPRQRIAYSPYAIRAMKADSARNADTIDGKHAIEFYTKNQLQNSGESAVHWENLINVPPGFADGEDSVGSGVTDHGQLTGLSDDDHPQYLNNSRGDSRYVNEGQSISISSDMIQNEAIIGTKIKKGEIWTTNNNTFTLKIINTGTGYAFEAQATAGNDPVDPNPR
jgi:hypothetical protein